MPRRKPPEEKLADLEKQEAQLKARISREKARLREKERKQDTRRKIIAGALALEHKDGDFQHVLNRLLDEYVTRPDDRALFGLDPLPEQADR
jgi:hypothetical protein